MVQNTWFDPAKRLIFLDFWFSMAGLPVKVFRGTLISEQLCYSTDRMRVMIGKVDAIVLFVDDLDKCMRFYRDTLGFKVTFNDDVSFAFRVEDQDFVLLKVSAAVDMLGEAALSPRPAAGHRVLHCVGVKNVDAVYEALTAKGLAFIKPPISQPWGRRTAHFADPEGNLWELWHSLETEG
jgi:lactoylglutathione lyase